MPVIACSHCKARFKVNIDTMGQTVKCPKCRRPFKAVALHSAPRKAHGTPPIVYAAIAVGALLIAALVVRMGKNDAPIDDATETKPAAAAPPPKDTAPPPAPVDAAAGMRNALITRAQKIVEALRTDDDPMLPQWIDYPRMHAELMTAGEIGGEPWTGLTEPEKYALKETLLARILGEGAVREFSRHAVAQDLEVVRMGQGNGEVKGVLKNPLTDETREATFRFSTTGGTWKLFALDRAAPAADGTGADEVADAPTLAPPALNRNPEGDVETVPWVDGTSSSMQNQIESAISRLTDPGATTAAGKARRDLVAVGKAAIPGLLNALVPLDLSQEDDLLVAMKVTQTLMDLTGEDHLIVPGSNTGSLIGEGAKDNEVNRRRWFGWWRDHKATYSGPPRPDDDDF